MSYVGLYFKTLYCRYSSCPEFLCLKRPSPRLQVFKVVNCINKGSKLEFEDKKLTTVR